MARIDSIATKVRGQLVGSGAEEVTGVESLVAARKQHVAFYADPRRKRDFEASKAGCVLVRRGTPKPDGVLALIEVSDPEDAFIQVCEALLPHAIKPPHGIHPTAVVAPSANIHPEAMIGAYVVIGERVEVGAHSIIHSHCAIMEGVKIGTGCVLYPHCTLREFVTLGNEVLLQPGVVLGGDGFGYRIKDGELRLIPHLGTVEVQDKVHIGANTTVDRARFGKTLIKTGTKIDNLVQIAHNVRIGTSCGIAGQSGIAGSAQIGDFVNLGGASAVSNGVHVGSGATVMARGGVFADLEAGAKVYGMMYGEREYMRLEALHRRLPELYRRVKDLERALTLRGVSEDEAKDARTP